MRHNSGMTMVELMTVMAIIALLTVIALPSYQSYQARGLRSQGQQFLMDLAQAQEQYFLEQKQYATDINPVATTGMLTRSIPATVSAQYTLTQPFAVVNAAGAPPTFLLVLTPVAGATIANAGDGALLINSLGQRWREADGNLTYNPNNGSIGDCTWEATTCVPH